MRYDFYKKVAYILAKQNKEVAEKLFVYIIHAMDDDGGFLRTRYCYSKEVLPNQKLQGEVKTALVALSSPFNFDESAEFYGSEETLLKMQIFYYDLSDGEIFKQEAEVSAAVGYPYPIKIDMERGTFEIMDKVIDYDKF